MKILECVPNVSEGRNLSILDLLSEEIRSVKGVQLLHRDIGIAANRTVYTFAGEGPAVTEAAVKLYRKSAELLDMRTHTGTHPRQGIIDVCPLIPLGDMSMKEAVDFSRQLAGAISDYPGIPGYFYEFSTLEGHTSDLAHLRKGEYEGIPHKLHILPPDFGSAENWPKYGFTILGARNLLVAYNVNLNTRDVGVARQIAENLRESGKISTTADGKKERIKGKLKSVKGLGWYIDDFQKAQVSFNLTDLQSNGLLEVFLACREEAEALGFKVSGSELVGLAPLEEFWKIQRYLKPEENELHWDSIIEFMGLSEVKKFRPRENVIEYLLQDRKD